MPVEVDFHKTFLDVIDSFVVDGGGFQLSRERGLEKNAAVVARGVGYALHVKLEVGLLEEEVDVFQISLHVFVDRCLPIGVEVVLNLHLVVDENLAPTFGEHDFLLVGRGAAVA